MQSREHAPGIEILHLAPEIQPSEWLGVGGGGFVMDVISSPACGRGSRLFEGQR